jgi:hypothetical protein
MNPYLSVCAIYCWAADYLREWIEFHRLVGVERFFLYNHNSDDHHLEVLEPYLRDGTVVLHDWPDDPGQRTAYEHFLREHRDASRWAAFIDTDEFLFSPTRAPVPELLRQYEEWPGVAINRVNFGPSGHRTQPHGLVIESYLTTLETPPERRSVKTIVDPRRVVQMRNPHAFRYAEGAHAVDENKDPVEDWLTSSYTHALLRVNHYITRSLEEYRLKCERPRAATTRNPRTWPDLGELERQPDGPGARDETILAYLPDLKRALARSDDVPAGGGEPAVRP